MCDSRRPRGTPTWPKIRGLPLISAPERPAINSARKLRGGQTISGTKMRRAAGPSPGKCRGPVQRIPEEQGRLNPYFTPLLEQPGVLPQRAQSSPAVPGALFLRSSVQPSFRCCAAVANSRRRHTGSRRARTEGQGVSGGPPGWRGARCPRLRRRSGRRPAGDPRRPGCRS